MIINALELENIRSYTKERLEFPEGVTLLAGDIGSGKSTVLLAIEFALFGIRRGDIQGDGLLRHGEKHGRVTLTFTTNKQYTISRTLKRTSQGVRQETGFLAIGDEHEDLSAVELKARVLELLGYPEDLLTKSKGFVFRYTVYTPQEEMKHILYERDQDRLDTLRSVFGIDRYRLVQENAEKLGKALRDDKRFLQGQLGDVPALEQELAELRDASKEVEEQVATARTVLKQRQEAKDALEKEGEALEEAFQEEQVRRRKVTEIHTKQQEITEQLQQLSQDRRTIEHRLAQSHEPVEDPTPLLDELAERRRDAERKHAQALAKQESLDQERKKLEDAVNGITKLETCPRCKQPVTEQHKKHIEEDAKDGLSQLAERYAAVRKVLERTAAALDQIAQKEESLRARKKFYETYKEFLLAQKQAQEQQATLDSRQEVLEQRHRALQKEHAALTKSSFDETAYQAYRGKLRQAQQELTEASTEAAKLSEQKASHERLIERLKKQLAARKQQQEELALLTEKERWLSKAFIPTANIIEKHVLAAIQNEFNRLFTKWFSTLIEDDSMHAELSELFAPVVTQNGYDADITHLSGGEKTAVALAYRLALNSVINGLLRNLHTTDLLILDEPTDGFSSEQLDRVRDVLEQLDCKQIIIVSHEAKMESYVNHVIRVVKDASVSLIT